MRMTMSRRLTVAVATACIATLSACGGGGDTATTETKTGEAAAPALDPILANPQVGDLYAAELTHFSRANFNQASSGGAQPVSYGLLKVVDVNPTQITVITEMGAWPQQDGALNDLAGDHANISWDESERIPINRADLARLVADGKILRTRRMTAGN